MKLILIVDDNPLMRRALRRVITKIAQLTFEEVPGSQKPTIWEAASGEEAVTMMRAQEGAQDELFLLTDGNMPGMNGDALIMQARLIYGEHLKKTVLLTGSAEEFAIFACEQGVVLLRKGGIAPSVELRDQLRPFLLG